MLYRPSKKKAFLVIAAIGVSAVLMIVVFGVAALVGQTYRSLGVAEARAAAFNAMDALVPQAVAEHRKTGAAAFEKEFPGGGGRCSFQFTPASGNDSRLKRLGIKADADDLIVQARLAPDGGPALSATLLYNPDSSNPRPWVILELQR
ncbi:MAG: hypothetical protein Kow0059_16190 [Candidatus Sumerlaeia bacterium]